MKALNKSGSSRTLLMAKVNGDVFYNFRALHFQHTYGNLKEMEANTAIMRQISGPEKDIGVNSMALSVRTLLRTLLNIAKLCGKVIQLYLISHGYVRVT